MVCHKNLMYAAFLLVLAHGVFGSLIQWSSVNQKQSSQLPTIFDGSNVEYEDCGSPADVLLINYINVKPDTIEPGKEFTVEAEGLLHEAVKNGAVVDVTVKLGLIKLISKSYDLCELIAERKDSDIKCPIPAGVIKISEKFTLPKETPKAKFSLSIRAYTVDEFDLACLNIKVDFFPPRPRDQLPATTVINNYFFN